jgi:hypothetical protein
MYSKKKEGLYNNILRNYSIPFSTGDELNKKKVLQEKIHKQESSSLKIGTHRFVYVHFTKLLREERPRGFFHGAAT